MSETPENTSNLEERLEKKRYYWIDHARGFIMIMLVVTQFLPEFIRYGPARFFLAHPVDQTTTIIMNFYDIGTPAFICIMGLLMPLSFLRRKDENGVKSVVLHMVYRYGFLLILGLIIVFIDQGTLIKQVDGMAIICWDVLPTLGLVGLMAVPFFWLKPKPRAIVAFGMLIFYQLMVIYAGWRDYAIASVHGGILGTVFGFAPLMIISTSMGQYIFLNEDEPERKKYRTLAIIGFAFLVVGLSLAFIPEWYANKRQVTLSYILISTGTIILLSFIFIFIERKVEKPIFILDSYGKNPFLLYIIAVLIEFLISDIIEYEIDLIIGPIMIVIVTIIAILLDKYKKIIKL